ncbi:unnamed protein product [Camellia sinensis]
MPFAIYILQFMFFAISSYDRCLQYHLEFCSSRFLQSVALIIIGAFIAGARDLSFDSYGYAVVFMANITTAIYLATIARIGKSSGLNSFGLMWCNGILCGPFLLFWTFIRGDLEITLNFPYLFSPGFLIRDFEYNLETQESRKQELEKLMQDQETLRNSLCNGAMQLWGGAMW